MQVTFITSVSQFCEKAISFMVILSKPGKIWVFLSLSLVYISLAGQLLLPTVKPNGVKKPISIEYKMVHDLNQAVSVEP